MDLKKTKILLDKINRLHQGFLDSKGNVSTIEKNLMLDYLSTMYDAIVMADIVEKTPKAKVQPIVSQPVQRQSVVPTPQPVQPVQRVVPAPQPVKPVIQKPVVQAPTNNPKPVVQKVAPVVKQVAPTPPPVQPVKRVEPVRPVVNKKEETPKPEYQAPVQKSKAPKANPAFEELFTFESAGELSEKLANKPIKSIKKAMGINEKYLISNELFGGDNAEFEATVKQLDKLENFAEARDLLENNTLEKFGWLEPQKLKRAKEFIKLVQSRYKS